VTDLSLYDAVLVARGAGEESDVASDSSGDIWSLYYETEDGSAIQSATGLALTQTLRDGLPIHEAIIMPQTNSQDDFVVDPLGVWVHEFGHWLGLPDLYCTGFPCIPDGVGKWSLMGDGIYNRVGDAAYGSSPAQLDAWSKVLLGWVTPVEAASLDPGAVRLGPVETEPIVYKLPVSSDPAAAAQYFLIENRQRTGWDAGLPGHGLLVWLVDESVVGSTDCVPGSASRFCQNAVNNNPLRPGVRLVEADGDGALQKYGCSGADRCGAPDPSGLGRDDFTPTVRPQWLPRAVVNLRDISEDGRRARSLLHRSDRIAQVVVDVQGTLLDGRGRGDVGSRCSSTCTARARSRRRAGPRGHAIRRRRTASSTRSPRSTRRATCRLPPRRPCGCPARRSSPATAGASSRPRRTARTSIRT
jgi:M6 family metalloprotease-like protein